MADENNIFLFVPNLIGKKRFNKPRKKKIIHRFLSGYARVVLGIGSLYFMPHNHVAAASLYILSGFLDAFDGYAARALNQSISRFSFRKKVY